MNTKISLMLALAAGLFLTSVAVHADEAPAMVAEEAAPEATGTPAMATEAAAPEATEAAAE